MVRILIFLAISLSLSSAKAWDCVAYAEYQGPKLIKEAQKITSFEFQYPDAGHSFKLNFLGEDEMNFSYKNQAAKGGALILYELKCMVAEEDCLAVRSSIDRGNTHKRNLVPKMMSKHKEFSDLGTSILTISSNSRRINLNFYDLVVENKDARLRLECKR